MGKDKDTQLAADARLYGARYVFNIPTCAIIGRDIQSKKGDHLGKSIMVMKDRLTSSSNNNKKINNEFPWWSTIMFPFLPCIHTIIVSHRHIIYNTQPPRGLWSWYMVYRSESRGSIGRLNFSQHFSHHQRLSSVVS
jgi:hypothetical protein